MSALCNSELLTLWTWTSSNYENEVNLTNFSVSGSRTRLCLTHLFVVQLRHGIHLASLEKGKRAVLHEWSKNSVRWKRQACGRLHRFGPVIIMVNSWSHKSGCERKFTEVNRITCNPELRTADTWSRQSWDQLDFCFWPQRELKHYRGRAFTTAAIVAHNAPWVIVFTLTQHICFLWGSFYFCAIFTQWCYH